MTRREPMESLMFRLLPPAMLAAALLVPLTPLTPATTVSAQDPAPVQPQPPAEPAPSAAALAERLAESDDDETRSLLLDQISQLGANAGPAVGAVADVAADETADESVRLDAIETLLRIGRRANAAVPTLLRMKADSERNARLAEAAGAALDRMGAVDVEKLTVAKAGELIRAYLLEARPNLNPAVELKLVDRTTPEMWIRLGAQVFVNDDSFLWNATFLVYRGQVMALGTLDFGGANDFTLVDLDMDGQAELFFEWSFGSGILRSSPGAVEFDEEKATSLAIPTVRTVNSPVTVSRGGPSTVIVTSGVELGRYAGSRVNGHLVVRFATNPDLPQQFRDAVPNPPADGDDKNDDNKGD